MKCPSFPFIKTGNQFSLKGKERLVICFQGRKYLTLSSRYVDMLATACQTAAGPNGLKFVKGTHGLGILG